MDTNLTGGCPQISVIIPTYNRGQFLPLSFDALLRQTLPPASFEVIVVSDGSSDHTSEVAAQYSARINLRLIEQPHSGQAAARNRGASAARAPLLVFLDDDIEAQPRLLEEHLSFQQRQPGVVIGYIPPFLDGQKGFFRSELFAWWEHTFQELRQPYRRARYTDLISGNFSIPAQLFSEVKGFNPDLRCHEDYELGLRLLRKGVRFSYSDAASGRHHERSNLNRALIRKYEEGIADSQLGRLAPEIKPALLMSILQRYALPLSRLLKLLAFRKTAFDPQAGGDSLARLLRSVLDLMESLRLLRSWQRLLYALMGYWYWRGVAQEFKSLEAIHAFLKDKPPVKANPLEVDLALGIEAAEQMLALHRPEAVLVCYGGEPVCYIPADPAAEGLRPEHLRPILATQYPISLLKAMAKHEAFPFPAVREQLIARCETFLGEKHEDKQDG